MSCSMLYEKWLKNLFDNSSNVLILGGKRENQYIAGPLRLCEKVSSSRCHFIVFPCKILKTHAHVQLDLLSPYTCQISVFPSLWGKVPWIYFEQTDMDKFFIERSSFLAFQFVYLISSSLVFEVAHLCHCLVC